ncbi:MAG: tRNA-dihydrouridine synthase family protein [Candidatus Omnitrophica bacterium]|nr:tRNA-dihydrouridine synthase family protein [Candidatus Omnitrophota bacterium]
MKKTLYMAPILGVTGSSYRNAYSRFFEGYDCAVLPFIKSSKGRRSTLNDILPERNNARFKLIPQVLDKDPEYFIPVAKAIFDLGYDTLNWNLGCPLPMVRNKGRGSGMLPLLEEITAFLDKVLSKIPNRLSIKVRLGSTDNKALAKLLPRLNNFPLEEIIIHPRTGKQMYKGEVDLDAFQEALSLTKHTIVYSGDIDSVKTLKTLSKRFPRVNRWMIGRSGITDPFLPEEIRHITHYTDREKLDRFLSFHAAVFAGYQKELSGPAHLIGKMKEVWRYWADAFEGGNRLFFKITRTKTVKTYLLTVSDFFATHPNLNI